jgi:hypothetical protein
MSASGQYAVMNAVGGSPNNGIYISGEMMKLDENLLTTVNKLQTFYEKFKSKWAKVLAVRKKTKPTEK